MDFTRIPSTMRLVLLLILHAWSYTYVSTSSTSSVPSTSTNHTIGNGTTHVLTSEEGFTSSSSLSSSSSSAQSTNTSAETNQPTTTASPITSTLSATTHTTVTISLSGARNSTSVSLTTHTAMTTTPTSTATSVVTDYAHTTSTTGGAGDTAVTSSQPTTAVSTPLPSTTPIITTTDYNGCNGTHRCDINAYCNDTIDGGHNCTCKVGFEGDGFNCTDKDECKSNHTNNCHPYADCHNTVGGFNCTCRNGFDGNGTTCTDKDECKSNHTNNCHPYADCHNTVGGYNCTCRNGFDGNGTTCTDEDECKSNHTNNCHPYADCHNTVGGYNCTCRNGFDGNGTNCTDKDECKSNHTNNCHSYADCHNTVGGFNCTCRNGFDGNGTTCADKDECKNKTLCDFPKYCVNTVGNFSCKCKPEYYLDEDDNQCVPAKFSYVGYMAITVNTDNRTALLRELRDWLSETVFINLTSLAYIEILIYDTVYTNSRRKRESASVNITYILHTNEETTIAYLQNLTFEHISTCSKECNSSLFTVVNGSLSIAPESALCALKGDCDPFSTNCIDANGRLECVCKTGFERNTNPFSDKFCTDIDECVHANQSCMNYKDCKNTQGNWTCICKDGFEESALNTSTKQCTDKCVPNPCKNDAKCEHGNGPGLFYCRCTSNKIGPYCEDVNAQMSTQDDSEASKFRTILIAVGASLGSICFLLLIVTCRVCRRNQSRKHPEQRPLSTHMNDYEMDEKKGTYQMPRAHINNEVDRPSKMEDKQSTYHIPRAQLSNTGERHYDVIEGGRELNVLDERSSKEDKLEREPLTKSIKEAHEGAENRSFLHDEAERRRSQNPGKSGVDYF